MSDNAADILVEYSEWLDGQGLVVSDGSPLTSEVPCKQPGEGTRDHSELVRDFLSQRRAPATSSAALLTQPWVAQPSLPGTASSSRTWW